MTLKELAAKYYKTGSFIKWMSMAFSILLKALWDRKFDKEKNIFEVSNTLDIRVYNVVFIFALYVVIFRNTTSNVSDYTIIMNQNTSIS